jgi:peptidoglycan/xylan/chitin deacetylase (PgdA/CDA1 family)/glycosyltransferase involved in cell wall biosynthesis
VLSIVIPTCNRAQRLRACLDALGHQTQPISDFEVVVVDDGSTDDTAELLGSLTTPFSLRVVRQENRGYGAARNAGVEAASGTYLLFMDDDVVASPELVAEHLRMQHEHGGGVGVIGPYPPMLRRGAGRFAQGWAEMRLEDYRALEIRTPTFASVHTGNFSAPRASVQAVGSFATDLPRDVDIELGYRLQEAGMSFVFAPRALGKEDHRESSTDMLHDAELRGANALELWRSHPSIIHSLHLGGHWELSRGWSAVRVALLTLHVPPRLLDLLGLVVPRSRARRWYRFLYSYCYWRGVRRTATRETCRMLQRGTPILMYHSICRPGEPNGTYVLPVRRFERQMRWLKRLGYDVIGLEELVSCLREHRLPPAKSVVLTFDDGYEDNRDVAAPILERLGFPATFFLVSAPEDGRNIDSKFSGRSLMRPAEARELLGGVVHLGAHTRTHPDLTSLAPDQVESEVAGSRSDLEEVLGIPITLFAYPYGKTNAYVQEAVRRAGFLGACSVEPGRNRLAVDPYMLKRLEVRGTDSLLRFALTVWIGETRSLFKFRAAGEGVCADDT